FRFQAGVIPALACVLLVAAFGFALSWIFAFVSLVVRGAETAQTAGFVLLFPLVFASSVFVPVSSLPHWLRLIAKASPVTLTADAARTLALTGGVPHSLGGALAWIVGIVAVFVPLSVWRYRRMSYLRWRASTPQPATASPDSTKRARSGRLRSPCPEAARN